MKQQAVCGTLIAALVLLVLASLSLMRGEAIAQGDPTPSPDLEEALKRAANFSGGNADWTPVIQEIDGVAMVLVPAGSFEMGSTEDEIDYTVELCQPTAANGITCERRRFAESEAPTSTQTFAAPFWIDKYEVSRAQYQQCVDAGECDAVPASEYSTEPNQPINHVNWFQAQTYCEWVGARLPTEAEWEYAARGPDRWRFPWGNEFDGTLANHCDRNCGESDWGSGYPYADEENDDGYAITAPVDSYPGGASWVGALNMSGNVWEWTYSLSQDYPYDAGDGREQDTGDRRNVSRIQRGGSFGDATYHLRAANRFTLTSPDFEFNSIGFRCARSIDVNSALPAMTAEPTPEPTPVDPETAALPAGAHNADWTPVIEEFDGVEMVLVPAGCFMMGSTDEQIDYAVSLGGQRERLAAEQPVHEVCFEEPFWIDQTEVTNAQFAAFNGESAEASRFSGDDRPRERIAWTEAAAFCESRGARLPTEAEWEYTARGPDGLVYPWGNEWDQNWVIGYRSSSEGTAPVGSIPVGMSWVGALDLSGNVWEWVADWYGADYYGILPEGAVNPQGPASGEYRVVRGGAWAGGDADHFRAALRSGYPPYGWDFLRGFRCARSVDTDAMLPAVTAEPTPTPTPVDPETASLPAGAHNADWTPVIQTFDGVEMVLVPAGCFLMGSTDEQIDYAVSLGGQREWIADEQPVHEVCFEEPFWIDKYEVTNGQFAAFNGQAAEASYFSGNDRPREMITWTEAAAFCESRGARLPTEAEWEYAARGPDGLVYPWGNEWENRVIGYRSSSEGTAPVGSKPAGVSWVGALDMSGNVWEWVADWEGAYPNAPQVNPQGPDSGAYRVMRGGSWFNTNTDLFRAALRYGFNPQHWSSYFDFVGFRCVRSMDAKSALPAVTAEPTPTPTLADPETAALPAGAHNADWTPVIQEFDGVEMVLVPAGCFMMGSTDEQIDYAVSLGEQSERLAAEQPVHEVCFEEPFWIDKYEMTNGQFAAFNGQAVNVSYFSGDDRPRENITWFEAQAFCESRGARLPTEAEWEYAARGPDGLVYPWGNEWDQNRVIGYRSDYEGTAPVGSIPAGASWVGALDLSGNVWEWVADWYGGDYYGTLPEGAVNPQGPASGEYRVLRGGSWFRSNAAFFRAALRYWSPPLGRNYGWGCRCARSR